MIHPLINTPFLKYPLHYLWTAPPSSRPVFSWTRPQRNSPVHFPTAGITTPIFLYSWLNLFRLSLLLDKLSTCNYPSKIRPGSGKLSGHMPLYVGMFLYRASSITLHVLVYVKGINHTLTIAHTSMPRGFTRVVIALHKSVANPPFRITPSHTSHSPTIQWH